MSAIPILLAAEQVDEVLEQWQGLSPATKECLIVLGAIALITLPVVLWVKYFRKMRRRQHKHQHRHYHSHETNTTAAEEIEGDTEEPRKRRKWRRPRREHRPRNPTLAETGGLPPVRTGEPPEILP